jgi:hypothetical protein
VKTRVVELLPLAKRLPRTRHRSTAGLDCRRPFSSVRGITSHRPALADTWPAPPPRQSVRKLYSGQSGTAVTRSAFGRPETLPPKAKCDPSVILMGPAKILMGLPGKVGRRPVAEGRGQTIMVRNAAFAGTDRCDEAADSSAGSEHRPAAAIGATIYPGMLAPSGWRGAGPGQKPTSMVPPLGVQGNACYASLGSSAGNCSRSKAHTRPTQTRRFLMLDSVVALWRMHKQSKAPSRLTFNRL